jgi:serine/threonine protein kinase
LGSGGFGQVYLIEDPTKRLYGLKEFFNRESAGKEIQLMELNFNSSFLVKYYSQLSAQGKTYIFMEYCEKGDLFEWIANQKSFPPENVSLFLFYLFIFLFRLFWEFLLKL